MPIGANNATTEREHCSRNGRSGDGQARDRRRRRGRRGSGTGARGSRARGGGGVPFRAGPGASTACGRWRSTPPTPTRSPPRPAARTSLYNCANPPQLHALGAGVAAAGRIAAHGRIRHRCRPGDDGQPLRLRRGRRPDPRRRSRSRPPVRSDASACGCGRTRWRRSRAGRVRVTEARASDFVGPESGAQAHLGDQLFPRVLAGKKVRVFGDADMPHSWTYVPDVARTLGDARDRRPVVGSGVARAVEPAAHPARGDRVDRGDRRGPDAGRRDDLAVAWSAPPAWWCRSPGRFGEVLAPVRATVRDRRVGHDRDLRHRPHSLGGVHPHHPRRLLGGSAHTACATAAARRLARATAAAPPHGSGSAVRAAEWNGRLRGSAGSLARR